MLSVVTPPRLAATLLVAATLAFYVGSTAEQQMNATPPSKAQPTAASTGETTEQIACERSGGDEDACAKFAQSAPSTAAEGAEGSPSREAAERAAGFIEVSILGLGLESPMVIGAVVLVSLGLAASVWLVSTAPWLLVSLLAFAMMTGLFDLREIPFQVSQGNGLLVGLAALAAALHFGAAGVAGVASRRLPAPGRVSPTIGMRGSQHASGR